MIDLGPEVEAFRAEMRGWISTNAPSGLAEVMDWFGGNSGGHRGEALQDATAHPLHREWDQRLTEAKLVCAQWPAAVQAGPGLGRRALRRLQRGVRPGRGAAGAGRRGMGETLVGPAIIVHGTDEQKAYFLPRIIDGAERYCQGYSEPDHGSDLGAVSTSGVVDGDEIVITGQKVWTSGAQRANMIFVLCRTDPDVPKHRGLSYVLVPFSPEQRASRVRPLRQMSGRVGLLRGLLRRSEGSSVQRDRRAQQRLGAGHDHARLRARRQRDDRSPRLRAGGVGAGRPGTHKGKAADPLVRQQLAWSYTQVEIMRFAGLRLLAGIAREGARARRPRSTSCLERVPQALRRDRHRRRGRGGHGPPDGFGYATEGVAGHLPLQPFGDHLLRVPARSRGTSSASALSGCPRSPASARSAAAPQCGVLSSAMRRRRRRSASPPSRM